MFGFTPIPCTNGLKLQSRKFNTFANEPSTHTSSGAPIPPNLRRTLRRWGEPPAEPARCEGDWLFSNPSRGQRIIGISKTFQMFISTISKPSEVLFNSPARASPYKRGWIGINYTPSEILKSPADSSLCRASHGQAQSLQFPASFVAAALIRKEIFHVQQSVFPGALNHF